METVQSMKQCHIQKLNILISKQKGETTNEVPHNF